MFKHIFAGGTRIVSKRGYYESDPPANQCDLTAWGWETGIGSGLCQPIENSNSISEDEQYFYHQDHLGSSSYMTNVDGLAYQHLEYFPFGEIWVQEYETILGTEYYFSGKEFDNDTQLSYFGARYYDPRTSVWQSPDPILKEYIGGEGSGEGVFTPPNIALYSYTQNRPIVFNDPDGARTIGGGGSGFGGGGIRPPRASGPGMGHNGGPNYWNTPNTVSVYNRNNAAREILGMSSYDLLSGPDGPYMSYRETQSLAQQTTTLELLATLRQQEGTCISPEAIPSYSGALAVQYGSNGYPLNNGATGPEVVVTLPAGTAVSRYGGLGGKYASPAGTSIGARSMPPENTAEHNMYVTTRSVDVNMSWIAPAYGQQGGGLQWRFSESFGSMTSGPNPALKPVGD